MGPFVDQRLRKEKPWPEPLDESNEHRTVLVLSKESLLRVHFLFVNPTEFIFLFLHFQNHAFQRCQYIGLQNSR